MTFYLDHYRAIFNEWDEEILAQAQMDWDAWVSSNQEVLLNDLEEDCAPTKRYHYQISITSIGDVFCICFNGQTYVVGFQT